MNDTLRILLVEDQEADAILIQRELRRQGLMFTARRVDRDDAMIRALREFAPDVVISDFALPGFSGLEALAILRKERPGVPLIFVSGTCGEEQAVDLLELGATDYVLKDHLTRLPASVSRALREARIERECRLAVEQLERQAARTQTATGTGHLSVGVAHDLNNLLAPIAMAVSMLRGKLSDPERERLLTIIEDSTRHASDIVRASLAAGRSASGGTHCTVSLPAMHGESRADAPAAAATATGQRTGAGECILLVDDEETIRFAARAVLSKHGYRVLTATDGADALKVFNAQPDEVALVLTDLMMPVMGGMALVQAVRRMRPGMPVIMSSGQNEKTRLAELAAAGIRSVLNKPYAADVLLRTVEEALGNRAAGL